MNYGFFFDYENDTIRLPVNPEKFSMKIQQDNEKKEVVGIGAINLIGNVQLQELEFEAEFPCQPQSYITTKNQFKGPYFYINKFKTIMKEKKPLRFVLTRNYSEAKNLDNISMLVTIEKMDIDEKALEEGDLYINFSLLEYKKYESKTVNIVIKKKEHVIKKDITTVTRPVSKPTPRTYTVVSGDSLWAIARKFYGNGSQYTKIFNANRDKIKEPSLIYPGQVFTIP